MRVRRRYTSDVQGFCLPAWHMTIMLWCIGILGFVPGLAAQSTLSLTTDAFPIPKVWLVSRSSQAQILALHLGVQMPEHHHGYLNTGDEGFYIPLSFSFPNLPASSASVTLISHPEGSRDETAQATVLRGYGEFTFHVEVQSGSLQAGMPSSAMFHYQICNDLTKLCYPPQELQVSLSSYESTIPRQSMLSAPAPDSQLPRSTLTWNERLYALFNAHKSNLVLTFMLVAVAGLLAAATPCVYPMLPITAAIFTSRGQGSWRRLQLHALVYFAGLVGFYAMLGLLASTTGTALSAVMTYAVVHLAFALLFTYLGISMLGLYEFQFLPRLMAHIDALSSQWQGFTGTLLMGATAGLIVSPCVGPIMGSILLDIAGKSAQTNFPGPTHAETSMLLRGVFLMSGFGLGLGLPFLCIGLLSSRLPHAGTWLTKTKYVLAFPIFYFAYTYYVKGMETAGLPLHIAQALLIGVLAIGAAVCSGVFQPMEPNASMFLRMKRTVSITLFIVGIYFLYNGLGQSGILLDPPRVLSSSEADLQATTQEKHGNLLWLRDFPRALQQAKAEGKPLFVDFFATWCANCRAFQQLTASNTQLNTALQQVVLVKIYDTDAIFHTFQQEPHYPELRGIGGQPLLPLFAIYTAGGAFIWKGQDYQAVSTMVAQLEQAKRIR